MDKQKLGEYKNKLEKERAGLLRQIGGEKPEDFGGDVDLDEEADEVESFGTKLAIDHDLKERISEIDTALDKIRKGNYGKCENCGKEISEEILNISPESKFCKDCKRKS